VGAIANVDTAASDTPDYFNFHVYCVPNSKNVIKEDKLKHYHKINTLFKRDMEAPGKPLILDQFAKPEFEYLADNKWEWTEKVDGTNIVIEYTPEEGHKIGGRTERAQIPADLYDAINKLLEPNLLVMKKIFESPIWLYGEGYGPKINKGGKYRPDPGFVLFDAFCGGFWLTRGSCINIAETLNLDIVPVVGMGTIADAIKFVKAGFTSTWGDFVAEGIVLRPVVGMRARNGNRIITKLKHKDLNKGEQ